MKTITSFLGVLLIVAASHSVFVLDKVSWFDASFGIAMGVGLIYVKNSKLSSSIFEIIKKNKEK